MKETLRRLAAWVMSLLMILNGLPVTALADDATVYDESTGIQLLGGAQESTKTYKLYCYGLVPGESVNSSTPVNDKWYGLSLGSINTTLNPASFDSHTILSQSQLEGSTIKTGSFVDITFENVTYKYYASEDAAADDGVDNYYTVNPIRIIVEWGANEGKNNLFDKNDKEKTFHYDFTINLHETEYCTVNFNVKKPDYDSYEAVSAYSARVKKGTEEIDILKPDASAVPPTIEYEGVTYYFDGWYEDAACTIKADFDGKITKNTNYYGRYVRRYTVTYKDGANGTVFADQSYTVNEGVATPAFQAGDGTNKPTRENYKFLGWKPEVADTVTGDVTYVAQWEPLTANYTVKYYLENVGTDGKPNGTYSENEAARETSTGNIGSTATWVKKTFTNYTYDSSREPKDLTILANGSLVIEVYYKRDTANLTIKKNVTDATGEATTNGSFQVTVKYGDTLIKKGTVSVGKDLVVQGLAVGEKFTVSENAGYAWTATCDPSSGEVTLGASGATVTFTNTRTLFNGNGQLTVKKEWKDGNKTLDATYIPDGGVQVQLYRQTDGGTPDPVGGRVTLSENNQWQHTYTKLPATDPDGNAYTYTVQEIGVVNGKLTASNGYRFTVSGVNQRCTTPDATITITNTLDRVDVEVTKTWELHGIKFDVAPAVSFALMLNGKKVDDLKANGNTFTLSNVPYNTNYTVQESYTAGQVKDSDATMEALFGAAKSAALAEQSGKLTAAVTNEVQNGVYGITISKKVTWNDAMTVTIPAFTFTVDGETVATLQPAQKDVEVSTQVLVSSNSVTVKETAVEGWTAVSNEEITVSAGGTAAFTNIRNTLSETQQLTIKKEISGYIDAMADDTFDFTVTGPADLVGGTVTYTVDGGAPQTATVSANQTFTLAGVKAGQTATVTSALPAGTYSVTGESCGANNKHAYSTSYTVTRDATNPNAFTVTNYPVTNGFTVKKLWQQPNGVASATTAYGDATATATFGLYASVEDATPLFTATTSNGEAQFTNVPTGAGKTYYVKEISVSSANYAVSEDVLTVAWDEQQQAFVFGNGGDTITNTLNSVDWTLNLTKQVKNCTDADNWEFQVKVGYTLPGGDSATEQSVTLTPDETETVSLTLPIGTTVTVTEVLGAAAAAWNTSFKVGETETNGTSQTYTVDAAGTLDVTIINDRVLFNDNGTLTLTKTWVDNIQDGVRPDAEAFADTLTLYSKAGEDGSWTETTAEADVDTDYTITYTGLPAYDLSGKAMTYAVAEAVTAPYTLSYTSDANVVTLTTGAQAITSGGFINTLEQDLTITKLWRNSDGNAIPAAQTTQVELLRAGDKLMEVPLVNTNDASMQTATISVPKYDEDGNAYSYTIHEVGDEHGTLTVGENSDIAYTVTYNGLTVTNTKAQPVKTATPTEVVPVEDEDGNIIDMVPVGKTITFTIEYENYLPQVADVTIMDVLPTGLEFVSSTPEAEVNGQNVTWTLKNVDALTSGTVTLVAMVTEDALTVANPSVSNTASITLGGVRESTTTTENTVYNPDWTVNKQLATINNAPAAGKTVKAGDTLGYTITVKNIGNCDLENRSISDVLTVDGEAQTLKVTNASGEEVGTFALAKGESVTFYATYTVKDTDTTLSNTAAVDDKTSQVDTTAQRNPLWTVEKTIHKVNGSHPDALTVKAGDKLTYAITVENIGNCNLEDLTISDVLTVDGEAQTLTVTNDKGTKVETFDLAKGDSVTFYATYTVKDTDTTLSNTAAVGKETGSVDTNVEANPQWTVDKTIQAVNGKDPAGKTVKAGDVVTYAITVKNTGNCGLEDLAIEDTFLVDGKEVPLPLKGSRNPDKFALAKGETIVFTAEYTVQDSDSVLSNAVNVGGVDSEIETTVEKNPLWTVKKKIDSILRGNETVVDVSKVQVGDELTYAITVENTGNCKLTGLKVSDVLTVDGEALTLTVTNDKGKQVKTFDLAKGDSVTFYATYTVKDTDTTLSNTAAVGDKTGSVDTNVEANPQWTVDKTIQAVNGKAPAGKTVKAGDVVTYAITVKNTGNCGLEDLAIEDTFLVDGKEVPLTLKGSRNPDKFALAKGETIVFTAEYTVQDSDSVLSNAVNVGGETDEVITDVEDNPKWTLDKALADETGNPIPDGQAPVYKPGDTVRYVITAVNTGNVDLERLSISDLFLVDGEDATNELKADAALTEPFGLAKGESRTFHASYVVKATDKTLSNTVTAQDKENEVVTEVEDTPAWTVTKYVLYVNGEEVGAEQTYNVGDKVTYAIVVTNAGNYDVEGLKAEDVLKGAAQANLKLTGANGENPDSFTLPRYSGEEKLPGTVTFLAEYTIQKADKVVTNSATVTNPGDNSDPEKGEAVIIVEDYPDVELVKTVDNKGTGKDGAFRGGDTIRYKVEVRNTGNCRLENLKVEDVFEVDGLLTGLKLEPASAGFALEAGESKTFYASYEIKATDTCLSNEATVANGDTEDGDKVVITTEPNPAVTVQKEVTNIGYGLQGAFLPGDEVDYRVTVTNVGNCDLYDLKLFDSLYGDGTRLKITLPEEAACFNLMKGETIVFEYSYRTQEGYGLLVNTAKVLGTTSRVKTRIVTDQISPEAMPPACGYTSNVGDCFD